MGSGIEIIFSRSRQGKKMRLLTTLTLLSAMFCATKDVSGGLITVSLNEGLSFQNEGTLQYDDTANLSTLDGSWGPTTTGTVTKASYATGSSDLWFDAISANFDLAAAGVDFNDIVSAELRFFAKNGTTDGWPGNHRYEILQGAKNTTHEDSNPTGTSFNLPSGDWITTSLNTSWFTSNSFDVTIRLWEVDVDAIELRLTTPSVPEPSSFVLLGIGACALGAGTYLRHRQKQSTTTA